LRAKRSNLAFEGYEQKIPGRSGPGFFVAMEKYSPLLLYREYLRTLPIFRSVLGGDRDFTFC
jgi:hypothetical protein